MRMITVTALDDCVYRGRFIPIGEPLTLPANEAAMLRYQGRVALASDTDATARARARRDQQLEPSPTRRRYRRRDLTAEE